jgi:hypothetical protein
MERIFLAREQLKVGRWGIIDLNEVGMICDHVHGTFLIRYL